MITGYACGEMGRRSIAVAATKTGGNVGPRDAGASVEEWPLSTRLADLPLSTRSHNALLNDGFETAAEIAAATDAELRRIRHFGQKSLDEVRAIVPHDKTLAKRRRSAARNYAREQRQAALEAKEQQRLKREARAAEQQKRQEQTRRLADDSYWVDAPRVPLKRQPSTITNLGPDTMFIMPDGKEHRQFANTKEWLVPTYPLDADPFVYEPGAFESFEAA